ncbi:LPS-assembly protein LptD [Candidatus Aquarickettsia rohweri]|uniref:LPS-assembly protein LptD n=1 Tax=Candidatus Aquarickettsia rohweri TaxID=2602574 RepID=A0A3S0FTA6_9RICK|nr:LPS-assembly protein LptD [Candidatus Aquarickettsia rohweri]RST71947.1 LPS-assembly protein LptD [Candidatus Aquarickettsia rohweri]
MINLLKIFPKLLIIFYFVNYTAYSIESYTNNNEIIIEADELIYNKNQDLISAQGNVDIRQNQLHLVVDKIVYDKKNNYLYVLGNLAFKNDNKNYFFGSKAFFNRNKNEGLIINFKARIDKKGLLSSNFAQMINNNTFIVQDIIFSTCKICNNNLIPNKPLWQISAKKAIVNTKEKNVKFKNSKIELFGTPIFYLPYLSIPTPNSPRKSGFLTPKLKNSNILGLQLSIPYYFNISPQMDITYTPTVSNKSNTLNSFNIRYLTQYGPYEINGNLINDNKICQVDANKQNKLKGFLNSIGNFNFKNNYFLEYQLQRLFDEDKTITKKYKITDDDVLTSKFSLRNETKERFLTFEGISFQNLRHQGSKNIAPQDSNNSTPYVIPWIRTYNKLSPNLPFISNLAFSTDILNLRRTKGESYIRSTFQFDSFNNINLPYGQILNIYPSIRYDYYDIKNNTETKSDIGTKNRLIGKLFFDWKWPFIKYLGKKNIILEPIVNFTYNSKTTPTITDEGSSSQIMSTSNIFSSYFVTGKNNVDVGSRLNFGLRSNYYTGKNTYGIILGQSYKLTQPKDCKATSYTWNKKFDALKTEIVSKFYAQLGDEISIVDNISLTPNHLELIKNELNFNFQHQKAEIDLNHIFINKKYINQDHNNHNQEIAVKLKYNFNNNWGIETQAKRKIGSKMQKSNPDNNNNWISNQIGLFYKGDCLKVNFGVLRDYSKLKNVNYNSSVTTYLTIEPIFN